MLNIIWSLKGTKPGSFSIVEMRLFKLAGLAGLSAASPTKPDSSELSDGSNTFSDSLRVDCYPENDADEAKVSTIQF